MNLPNKLTISRIILTFIFMFFLFSKGAAAKYAALGIFIAASLTDFYDGFIARKKSQITNFGKLMDPVADKLLTLAAFLAFVEMGLIPAWMVIIIIMRELFITGVRLIAFGRGSVLAAESGGKHKTVSQIAAIFLILIFLAAKESMGGFWNPTFELWFKKAVFYMMFFVVILTMTSAISFLKRNRKIFQGGM